ncbi:MAG: DUF2911 domain-containing protein [Cyclobacteriaceae bacterium]|jgi:hypothetical protein|nr:DUF2911 domain-containing protein [Cyclobacteriaceae bacterium]
MVHTINRILIVLAVVILGADIHAQQAVKPRVSPLAIAAVRYKDTYLKITYGQPHKRGREIFGQVVPFGEVWRTGANEATEITLTKDVYLAGRLIPVGTYSLFTIPYPDRWTIILNRETGLWGSYNYNQKLDFIRFDIVTADTGGIPYEAFTIQIDQRNSLADLILLWDQTKVIIPVQFIEPK